MTIYLKRLSSGFNQEPRYVPPPDHEDMWKVYTVCTSSDARTCTTRSDIAALAHPHKADVRDTLFKFHVRTHTGQEIKELFSKKGQCHPGHRYTDTKGQEVIIWRLWLKGKVRVYFIYLESVNKPTHPSYLIHHKEIATIHSCVKAKDDLDDGEKAHLKHLAENVLKCYNANKQIYL